VRELTRGLTCDEAAVALFRVVMRAQDVGSCLVVCEGQASDS